MSKWSYCWICCETLSSDEILYHERCCKRLFKSSTPPSFPHSLNELNALAEDRVRSHVTVPGVQAKLSLHLEKSQEDGSRLTLVGLEGGFILKPPAVEYPEMPELEHLTIQMAKLFKIEVEDCGLIPLESGERAFIARRMDREGKNKLHMEDFCQLTEKLTEQKYRASMEQVGKALRQYSSNPGFDAVRLYELTLFCFLTGNADMHLKNFSLLYRADGMIGLSPAYDLLATKLLMPQDMEELALTLNGKKSKLKLRDFDSFAKSLKLTAKQTENVHKQFAGGMTNVFELMARSQISEDMRESYTTLLEERWARLGL